MFGAIIGDIVGAPYEYKENKDKDFKPFFPKTGFTDDSIHVTAVCEWLTSRHGRTPENLIEIMEQWYLKYPDADYGGMFRRWVTGPDLHTPYGSYGNGAAARAVPIGLYARSKEECLALAELSASITHDHPEGIKGAMAAAVSVFHMKTLRGKITKEEAFSKLKADIHILFGYTCTSITELRTSYEYDDTCQGTVPQAIECILESTSFTDAIRNAVSIGGDADTLATITGGIAEAWYGIPPILKFRAERKIKGLDQEMNARLKEFYEACITRGNQNK